MKVKMVQKSYQDQNFTERWCKLEPMPNLQELAIAHVIPGMHEEIAMLRRELYKTPKWRKIKRYRLFEKIDQLEEDVSLQEHVWMDC